MVEYPSKEGYVVAAREDGNISIYKQNATYDLVHTLPGNLVSDSEEKDYFVSLFESSGIIVSASNQGKMTLTDLESITTETIKTSCLQLNAPLSTLVPHPEQRGIYAYGGKESDVKIIKLFDQDQKKIYSKKLEVKEVFKAKNVKNDKLDLRVPVWITNILFVELPSHSSNSWRLITTTRYGQVRKYDTKVGKKPIFDKKLSDKPLVCVTTTTNESEIICSDTHATTALFNVDKGVLVAKYKGSVGAVQDLYSSLWDDKSLLVTGGLDRYVRVFNIKSREQTVKVFTGSKISCVWLLDTVDTVVVSMEASKAEEKKTNRREKKIQDGDDDDIWNELDNLENKPKKRKVTK